MSTLETVKTAAYVGALGLAGFVAYKAYKTVEGIYDGASNVVHTVADAGESLVCDYTLAKFWDPLHVCVHHKAKINASKIKQVDPRTGQEKYGAFKPVEFNDMVAQGIDVTKEDENGYGMTFDAAT